MATSRRLAGFLPRALALGASALVSTALLPLQTAAAASAQATTTDTGTAAQINASHDGVVAHDTLTPPLALAWNINLGGSVSYPLVDNGRVFVTAINSSGSVPQLWALNQQTGATLWGPVVLSGPGWANATLDNGRIFVEDVKGFLQAFDENGNRIWGTQLTGPYTFSAPPTAANGIIYTSGAGSGLSSGLLYAIRETDGASLWTAPVLHGDYSSPVVSSTGVYVSYACAQTYDFNPTTGALIWQHAAACNVFGGTTPVLANGKLYVRDATAGNIILDASSGASLGTFTGSVTPAIAGSLGFFKDQYALYGYDLTSNTRLWSFFGDNNLTSAPIVVGGYVYVASRNGTVYALDPQTGAQVWTASTPFVCCMNGPNEQNNSQPLTGLGAGYGMLFVPTGYSLLAFGGQETLYPGDATWGYQVVGQPTIPAAPLTLMSNAPGGLVISSISTTGDFAQTNTCPPTLSFGSSCIISVTFTPSTVGSRTGTLTINDNAAGSPHLIPLAGSGSPSGNPPDHLVLSPASATISAGGSQTYQAEAFDRNNVDLGDVTASTAFSLDGIRCNAASCTTTKSGSHNVWGADGPVTGSATLSVGPGALDHLTVSPATATIVAGTNQSYTTEGFDVYGNDLGDQTSASSLSITPDGTCSGVSCTATKAAIHTVTASAAGKSGTATLSVGPAALASLGILPVSVTALAGGQTAFHAVASDQYGNPLGGNNLGEVTTAATFSIGANGTCIGSSCGSTLAGTYTVVTAYQGLTASATLTVSPATADHIRLTPANASIVAGASQTYTAQSLDLYGNTVADVSSSTTFSISPSGTCSANVCSATQAAYLYTVNATYSGMTAAGSLNVTPSAYDHLTISPASATITAGQYQPFSVFAVDQYGNPTADVSATTFVITPDGTCSLGSGSASCTATQSGPHTLTASLNGKSVSAAVTVNPGPVIRIRIAPIITTMPVGGSQAFTARTVDGYENSVADVTSATTFALSPNGACNRNVCTAPTQPTTNANVTGTYSGMTDLINLAVSPGPVDHITISPASSSMTAGQSQTYSDLAYDKYNNYVGGGNVTSVSTYAITPDGSCSGATCTATKAGPHTVTATYQGKTATSSLAVKAGPVNALAISPASLTLTVGQSAALTASATDAYGNIVGAGTATWAVSSGTPGKISSTTGTTTTFIASANTAGAGTILAHLGALTAQSAARVLPAAPKALTAIVEGAEVSLSWTASAGDRTYAVYRKTGTGAWALIKTGLTVTSFSDSGLTGGIAYKYYVTGRAVGLESLASNTVSIIAK